MGFETKPMNPGAHVCDVANIPVFSDGINHFPVAAALTVDMVVPASASQLTLANRGDSTGIVTITVRTSAGATKNGSFVLRPGQSINLPVAGMGGPGFPTIVRIVTAAATICDGFFHCNNVDGV